MLNASAAIADLEHLGKLLLSTNVLKFDERTFVCIDTAHMGQIQGVIRSIVKDLRGESKPLYKCDSCGCGIESVVGVPDECPFECGGRAVKVRG